MKIVSTRSELLKLLPPRSLGAELGVYDGAFSEEILRITQPRKLYLVDLWTGMTRLKRPDSAGDWVPYDLASKEAMEIARSRMAGPLATGQVALVRREATEWLTLQPAASLDWVYLDDDHTYPHVLKELKLAAQCIRPGGSILGHDYCDCGAVLPGVRQAVDEFCRQTGLVIDTLTDETPLPVYPRQPGMPSECAYNSYLIRLP